MLLLEQIKVAFMHPQFQSDVLKPMNLDNIMDQEVKTLSGGELQQVVIVLALGRLLCDKGVSLFCVYSHYCFFRAYSSPVFWIPSNISLPAKLSNGA